MGQFPDIDDLDGVGAVETPRERVHARRGRRWLVPLLASVGAAAVAMLLLADRCGAAAEVREIEALTADARRFVGLVRSGLPAEWSIEKVLEFPALRPGSQAMTDLQHKRGQARVNLENKVDALLPEGERPDLSGMTEWIASPSWMSRARIEALANELHRLDQAIAALRSEQGLDPKPLPLAGESLPPLPDPIALPALPDGVEHAGTVVWAVPLAAVVMQTGHGPACRERRPSCRTRQVTWVSWEGEVIDTALVAPPPPTLIRWRYGVDVAGVMYTVAVEEGGAARIATYEPGAGAPQVADVKLPSHGGDAGATEHGFVIEIDRYSDDAQFFVVRPGPTLEPIEAPGTRLPASSERLERREGSEEPLYTDGGHLEVLRREGAVFSTFTPSGAKAPEAVFRIADFTAHDEQYLRRLASGPGGVVLVLEGSKSRLHVLLSRDGGRTWTGAAAE